MVKFSSKSTVVRKIRSKKWVFLGTLYRNVKNAEEIFFLLLVFQNFFLNFLKKIWKILLTLSRRCDIIPKSAKADGNKSGCGAVGSALPWGGRGRKFKSCHSDQGDSKESPIFFVFLHIPRLFSLFHVYKVLTRFFDSPRF